MVSEKNFAMIAESFDVEGECGQAPILIDRMDLLFRSRDDSKSEILKAWVKQ